MSTSNLKRNPKKSYQWGVCVCVRVHMEKIVDTVTEEGEMAAMRADWKNLDFLTHITAAIQALLWSFPKLPSKEGSFLSSLNLEQKACVER